MDRSTRSKRFLGYTLTMDPVVEMWSSDRELDEVGITLNKHSDTSWSLTIAKGNSSLIGVGKTERAARDDLTRQMRDLRTLLGYFKVQG